MVAGVGKETFFYEEGIVGVDYFSRCIKLQLIELEI